MELEELYALMERFARSGLTDLEWEREGEKIALLAVCGKNAIARGVKAGALIKTVSAICGGSGGGKPDSAMGGGKDVLKLDDALAFVDDFVSQTVTDEKEC